MMGGFGAGFGMGLIGPVLMIGFWLLIIIVVVVIARQLLTTATAGRAGASQEDSALEVLRKRYAQGDIDKREFEEKRKLLAG